MYLDGGQDMGNIINFQKIIEEDTHFTFELEPFVQYQHKISTETIFLHSVCRIKNRYVNIESSCAIVTADEVLYLIQQIHCLMSDELEEDKEIHFLEPDVVFILKPELWGKVVEIRLYPYLDGLMEQYYSLELDENAIWQFTAFLKLCAGSKDTKNIYYTNSGRPLTFYKEQQVKDLEDSLNDLFEALLHSWEKETAYPISQDDELFDINSGPTYGQCAVTAMVVKDYLGGEIYNLKTSDGGSHYFNKIDGKFIDLARDQFDLYGISLDISKAIPVNLTYLGSNPNTQQRYQRLKRNVSSFLRKKDIPITSK